MTREIRTWLALISLTISLFIGFKYIFPLVAPFLLGAIFACLIEPIVRRINEQHHIPRKYVVLVLITGLLFFILSMLSMTVVVLYQEAQRLLPQVSMFARRFSFFETRFLGYLKQLIPQSQVNFSDFLVIRESIDRLFRSLLQSGINLAPVFPKILVSIGLGGVTAYFFSRDQEKIRKFLLNLIPENWQGYFNAAKGEIITGLAKFIRTEFILIMLTALLTSIIFSVLRISGAWGYGLLAGLFDLIPVLGPGLIYIPAVLGALLFQKYSLALGFGLGYFILIAIRQLIEVKLIGDNFNLHPLFTMMAVYIGMKLFGVAGAFFGPLLVIVLRGYYRIVTYGVVKKG